MYETKATIIMMASLWATTKVAGIMPIIEAISS